MLIFVNKPITALLYALGLLLVFLIGFYDVMHIFALVWSLAAFSILYCTSINYYYLLRGNEKFEIRGVDLRVLKGPLRIYWIVSLIGLIIAISIFSHYGTVFPAAFFLTFYNAIFAALLKFVIYSKFVSLALKKNPTFKDLKLEDFYTDIREVLLKKVID